MPAVTSSRRGRPAVAPLVRVSAFMEPIKTLGEGLMDALRGLLAQLPLIVLGIGAAGVLLLIGRQVRRVMWRSGWPGDPSLSRLVSGLIFAAFLVIGVLVGLWIAIPSVRFTEVLASLGVTGIILGFALRDIIENFVAGILILWRRPFTVSDQVASSAYEGTVLEINFRSTVLRTYDGLKVFIPNSKVFTEPLENLTAFTERRSTAVIGISQDASVAAARTVILKSLQQLEDVNLDPEPMVLFEDIGDFTNNLHVLYWTSPPTKLAERVTRSRVHEVLWTALHEAGVGVPYPIQTVRLERTIASPEAEQRA